MTTTTTTTPGPVTFDVTGDPRPQGSKTAMSRPNGGHPYVVEGKGPGRAKLKTWRSRVAAAADTWRAENGNPPPLDGPLVVTLAFRIPKGSSLPKWRWLPWVTPDLDKLTRAVFDGLGKAGGNVWKDDARVVAFVATEVYALGCASGVTVTIVPLGDLERTVAGSGLLTRDTVEVVDTDGTEIAGVPLHVALTSTLRGLL